MGGTGQSGVMILETARDSPYAEIRHINREVDFGNPLVENAVRNYIEQGYSETIARDIVENNHTVYSGEINIEQDVTAIAIRASAEFVALCKEGRDTALDKQLFTKHRNELPKIVEKIESEYYKLSPEQSGYNVFMKTLGLIDVFGKVIEKIDGEIQGNIYGAKAGPKV